MKLFKKISLRMRITLLTGLVLFAASFFLTLISIENAQRTFLPLQDILPAASAYPLKITKIDPPLTEDNRVKTTALRKIAKRKFGLWSYIWLFIVSAAGMCASYVIAGRALKPVCELDRAIAGITGHNMRSRIPEYPVKDEIGSLTHSFNEMLERLDESFLQQKRFSANVSHELKTPLSILRAGAQSLHMDSVPEMEDYQDFLSLSERNVKRMSEIVDNLMLLTNEENLDYCNVLDLEEMISQIKAELFSLYEEKKLHFQSSYEFRLIAGNRPLFNRALFNLLENAFKYNKHGGTIEVQTLVLEKQRQIIISDYGIGIPEADIDKIFEPFYRVDPSRSRKLGGAGLGLSIVKSIVENHRFTISAESTPAGGTRFIISIPGQTL